MNNVMPYIWVGLGSAVGGLLRFWISGAVAQRFGQVFPWGTMAVNVTGSFIIGFLAALSAPEGRMNPKYHQVINYFLMLGVCGGYTTFSSFSLQTLNLLRDGELLYAGGNVVLSVVVCMVGVWLGYLAGNLISK